MTTFFAFQAAVETMQAPDVSVVAAVTAITGLSKVWDRIYGRRKDQEMRRAREAIQRNLDNHIISDNENFAALHTSLAVLETGVGTITKQLGIIDQRMYSERPK
jgi:hypothetical protein